MVEPGSTISALVRFGRLFDMLSAPYAFLLIQRLTLELHVARPIDLYASCLSVCMYVRPSVCKLFISIGR